MNPVFLLFDEVLVIHADQVARYGGDTALRDEGLLRSALAQPEVTVDGEWLHPTLEAMAAAYLLHIVKNHAFVDGNKRTGLVCALYFLMLNGRSLEADPDELADLVLAVASGTVAKRELTEWLRLHLVAC